jgi:tetratricopeptide (TPR) repeat protein
MPDAQINDLLSRAVGAHRAGDLATAAAGYQTVLARAPDNVDAAHYLGMVEYQRGDLAAAAARVGTAARARPQDPAILANLGLIQLAAGQLDPAARALSASLRLAPDQPEAWHTLGLVRQGQGHTAHAAECHRRVLELAPGHREARLALVRSLIGDDEPMAAAALLTQGLRLTPADDELGLALGETLDRAGDPDRAAAELRALANRSPAARARALTRLSLLERRRDRPATALVCARSAVFADGQDPDARRALGQALKALGRLAEAVEHFRRGHELLRRPGGTHGADRPGFTRTSRAKLRHDIAQLEYLIGRDIDADRLRALLPDYRALLEALPADVPDGRPVPLPAGLARRAAPYYNRCHHLADTPRIDGPVINPALDTEALTAAYHGRAPGLTWIDGLLTRPALESLRRFCLESTIWYDFEHVNGYVGAYLQEGFNCPLLIQLAEALPRALPGIFGEHVLMQLWAYNYDSGLAGIDMHADFAAVNVNFWITPDEANLDPASGGLVLWDKEAPPDWGVDDYNTYDPAAQQRIRGYLAAQGARKVVVPHRQNRAVVFNSDLFHRTDDIRFRDGYDSRRINITMLYGTREADRAAG